MAPDFLELGKVRIAVKLIVDRSLLIPFPMVNALAARNA